MTKAEFQELIKAKAPNELAGTFLQAATVVLFASDEEYSEFRIDVGKAVKDCETVAVVGSGNWRFSLNPDKAFKEFDDASDVDVAIVSSAHYLRLWDEMRRIHRDKFYTLSVFERSRLRRNGENVYAGFVSPFWIPDAAAPLRFEYKKILNELSDGRVSYRPVKVLIFKNQAEAVDYYARGFVLARRALA
jgi:hypothetical protein